MAILEFGSARARRGCKAQGQFEARGAKKRVKIPTMVINGKHEGEHVVFIANQHGPEVNGVEAIRLLYETIDPAKLSGTIFAVPSANPLAAMLANEYYPENVPARDVQKYRGSRARPAGYDRNANPYNMNRRWPGQKGGLLVDAVVHEIWNRAVMAKHRKASLFLDIHCHQSPSAIYAQTAANVPLGIATGMPVVINCRSSNTLNIGAKVALQHGIPALTFELGKQKIMHDESIDDGVRALFNMLKLWRMVPGRPVYPERTLVLDPWRNDFAKGPFKGPSYETHLAKQAGLVRPFKRAYEPVRKGETICHVVDPFTGRIVQECVAGMSGVMYTPAAGEAAIDKGARLATISIARKVRAADVVKRVGRQALMTAPPL